MSLEHRPDGHVQAVGSRAAEGSSTSGWPSATRVLACGWRAIPGVAPPAQVWALQTAGPRRWAARVGGVRVLRPARWPGPRKGRGSVSHLVPPSCPAWPAPAALGWSGGGTGGRRLGLGGHTVLGRPPPCSVCPFSGGPSGIRQVLGRLSGPQGLALASGRHVDTCGCGSLPVLRYWAHRWGRLPVSVWGMAGQWPQALGACCLSLAMSSVFLLLLCLFEAASVNHFGHRLCTCAGGPLAEAFGFEFWAGCGADPGLCLLHGAKDRLSVTA